MNADLFSSDNGLETALLRSSLAFGINQELQGSRSQFLSQIISSLIMAEGPMSADDICRQFKIRFSKVISMDTVNSHLDKLTNKKKFLKKNRDTGKFEINSTARTTINSEYSDLLKQTSDLINNIVEKTKQLNQGKLVSDKAKLRSKIKDALTYFFRLFGLDILGSDDNNPEKDSFIKKMREDLHINEADALILALSETIDEQVHNKNGILKKWAKAYVFTQIAQLDPTLNSFELTQFKKKSFVLDTEVVLHCLVDNTRFCKEYKQLVETLLKCQCSVYVPPVILKEVVRHVKTSKNSYLYFKSSMDIVPENILLSTIANVFVEDYYNSRKQYASFEVYYDNFYDEEDPEELIKQLLLDKFKNIKFECKEVDKKDNYTIADNDTIAKYVEDILFETKYTTKGARRTEADNRAIAETDAYIYLGIAELLNGKKVSPEKNKDFLTNDMYFVTTSNRADKCARKYELQHDVCTNPNVLISILGTIGQFDDSKPLQLFDNPFLVNAAKETWDDVHNAIEFGLNLKGANVYQLKRKLDKSLKRWIVKRDDLENMNQIVRDAKEIGIESYNGELANRLYIKSLEKENAQLKIEAIKKDKTISSLRKDKAKDSYLDRVNKKRK